MNKKLFVGGIPFTSTEEALKALFSQAGNVVSATIIFDKMSGRSKGFGFIEMETEEEAQKAIEMFNGTEFEGRQISVNEAKPLEDRPPRSFGGGNRFDNNRSGGFRNDRAPRRDFDR